MLALAPLKIDGWEQKPPIQVLGVPPDLKDGYSGRDGVVFTKDSVSVQGHTVHRGTLCWKNLPFHVSNNFSMRKNDIFLAKIKQCTKLNILFMEKNVGCFLRRIIFASPQQIILLNKVLHLSEITTTSCIFRTWNSSFWLFNAFWQHFRVFLELSTAAPWF